MTDYLIRSNLREEGFILTYSSKVMKAGKGEWLAPTMAVVVGIWDPPFIHILLVQESRDTGSGASL